MRHKSDSDNLPDQLQEVSDVRRGTSFSARVLTYFSATVIQAAIAFLALPLTTAILDPSDYGVYALIISVVLFLSAATDCGANYLFSGHYATLDADGRRSLLTLALVTSLILSGVVLLLFISLWSWIEQHAKVEDGVSSAILWTAALSIPVRAINSIANQYLAVADRSGTMAILIVIQSLTSFVVTIAALFLFNMHVLSLFLGNTTGLAIAALASLIFLKDSIAFSLSGRWLWDLLRVAPASMIAGISESVRTAIENLLLSRFAGVSQVGYWSHSRMYHGFLMQATNAVAYVLWPVALREARDEGRFETVGRAWGTVYLWLVLAGVLGALLGREIISLLTHGKFIEAAAWVPLWVAYLLLQNAGKAATAAVYAMRKGVWAANFRIIILIPCLAAMWLLVPRLGIGGIMIVLFAEMVIYRLLIGYLARKLREIPFQDGWVIAGCALILGINWLVVALTPQFGIRVMLAVAIAILILGVGHRQVKDTYDQVRALFGNRYLRA